MGMLRKLDEARFFFPIEQATTFAAIGQLVQAHEMSLSNWRLMSDFWHPGPATTAMVFADVSVIGPHAVVVEGTYSAKCACVRISPRRSYAHGRRTLIRFLRTTGA